MADVTLSGTVPSLPGWSVIGRRERCATTGIETYDLMAPGVSPAALPAALTAITAPRSASASTCTSSATSRAPSCVSVPPASSPSPVVVARLSSLGRAEARWVHTMLSEDGLDFEEAESWGSAGADALDLVRVLTLTAFAVEQHGWMSRSRAGDYETATADYVSEYLGRNQLELEALGLDARHQATAQAIIEAVRSVDADGSEYLTNLKSVCSAQLITDKHLGLAVSAISVYQREQEQAKRDALPEVDAWVGAIGERRNFTVVIEGTRVVFGAYGDSTMYRFRTTEGHRLVWFCSGRTLPGASEGDTVEIVGTVKRHGEFRGTKQTNLNRVKLA